MKKYIVLTTINEPTKATIAFSKMNDWKLIVVGDLKTPHESYKNIDCIYLSPQQQENKYKDLSDYIGWKSIQRRNLGFIEAWNLGADLIATVDDDNIPYDNWGKKIVVSQNINALMYKTDNCVFDPLSATNNNNLWHRGFPIELINVKNHIDKPTVTNIQPLIQANLWDGDPDIDAIYRLPFKPEVNFSIDEFYFSNKIAPFNSQNTIIHREVLPYYAMIPNIGRMDDIWASYFVQQKFLNSVVFGEATVYQDRNQQDLVKNLKDEIVGYYFTLKLIKHLFHDGPTDEIFEKCKQFLNLYKSYFK